MHGFCIGLAVFLGTPTIRELLNLDLPVLIDMLANETEAYAKLLATEGFSSTKVDLMKETIVNLQAVIDIKQGAANLMLDMKTGESPNDDI